MKQEPVGHCEDLAVSRNRKILPLSYEQAVLLYYVLLGTGDSTDKALESISLDPADYDDNDVCEILSDVGLERCDSCDWWFPIYELVAQDDDEPGVCDNCRI